MFHVIKWYSANNPLAPREDRRCATLTNGGQRIVAQVLDYHGRDTWSVYLKRGLLPGNEQHGFTTFEDALDWAQANAKLDPTH